MTGGSTIVGLDYADQRFYASSYGRFNTPDPYGGSAGPSDPGSWNRYTYAGGDPINKGDPTGLEGTNGGDGCWDMTDGGKMWRPGCFVNYFGAYGSPVKTVAEPAFPECDHGGSPLLDNHINFILTHYGDAQNISQSTGVPANWLLAWTALESGTVTPSGSMWGTINQSLSPQNNYLGQKTDHWNGANPQCAKNDSDYACFSSYSDSLMAAFTSPYGNLLKLDAQSGMSAAGAFYDVAAAGWNPSPQAYGTMIQSIATGGSASSVGTLVNCLKNNGYL